MYLDKVLSVMTQEDKMELLLLKNNFTTEYTPKRRSNKKYKGNLVYRDQNGELRYW